MGNFASLTVTGGSQLLAVLRKMDAELSAEIKLAALRKAGEPMRQRMADMAPRGPDAPHLADNIKISPVTKIQGVRLGQLEQAVAIGPGEPYYYGLFWEYGWKYHSAAHPFARPAFDETNEEALKTLGEELWRQIAAQAPA